MGQLIHVNFSTRQCAFTLEFYEEPYRVSRASIYADNLHDAQAIAAESARRQPTVVAVMIFLGLAEDHRLSDQAASVMLSEDIHRFAHGQANSC